jgi:hypothetical protein
MQKMAAKKPKHKFLMLLFVKDILGVAALVFYVHYAKKTPMKSQKHKFLRALFVKDMLKVSFLSSKIYRPHLWYVFTMQKRQADKENLQNYL